MYPSFISHRITLQNAGIGCGDYLGSFLLKWAPGVVFSEGNLSSSAWSCPCAQRDLASPQVPWGHGLGLRPPLDLALAVFQDVFHRSTPLQCFQSLLGLWHQDDWNQKLKSHSSYWIQVHRAPGASETVTAQLWPRLFEVRAGVWEQKGADLPIIAKCGVKSAVLQGTGWGGDSCWVWRIVAGWPSREQSPA